MSKISVYLCLLAISFFAACAGSEEPIDEGTASLVVKVIHVDASIVKGAKVDLYESAIDYQNETNAIKTLSTDELGEAYFELLELKQYWFIAKFDGYSNGTSVFTTGRKLNKDERMEKTTQLRP